MRWELPGCDALRLTGVSGDLQTWTGRDAATGRRVVVTRWCGGEGADLPRYDEAHLARRIAVLSIDGDAVLVEEAPAAGTLAELLARRGPLSTGETVTALLPLAETLERLHAGGTAHGRVGPDTVGFGADGRPVLLGAGLGGRVAAAQDDVRALAALAGLPPAADAGELADRLRGLATPVPVSLAAAPAAPVRRGSSRRPLAVGAAGAVLVGCVLVVAGRAGGQSAPAAAPASDAPSVAAMSATAPAADWQAVVTDLERRRGAALRALDVTALRGLFAPGSSQLAADLDAVQRLTRGGLRPTGPQMHVRKVTLLQRDATRAQLRVVDDRAAYDLLDAAGRIAQHVAGRPATAFRLTLAWTGGHWLLADVVRAGRPASPPPAGNGS